MYKCSVGLSRLRVGNDDPAGGLHLDRIPPNNGVAESAVFMTVRFLGDEVDDEFVREAIATACLRDVFDRVVDVKLREDFPKRAIGVGVVEHGANDTGRGLAKVVSLAVAMLDQEIDDPQTKHCVAEILSEEEYLHKLLKKNAFSFQKNDLSHVCPAEIDRESVDVGSRQQNARFCRGC